MKTFGFFSIRIKQLVLNICMGGRLKKFFGFIYVSPMSLDYALNFLGTLMPLAFSSSSQKRKFFKQVPSR
jgi:hypothetical protein